MTSARSALLALSGALALATPGPARAQASASEMRDFPMPPPSGYFATKDFAYPGDWGYFLAPPSAVPGITGGLPSDYRYVRYRGLSGKLVTVYGAWGTTAIPPRSGSGDACGHAHASWGAWVHWRIVLTQPVTQLEGWTFLDGAGMSGVRSQTGRCEMARSNPLSAIDPRYGWGGAPQLELDLRSASWALELVVGALSNTHGWGTCTTSGFLACIEPSYIIGYTLR